MGITFNPLIQSGFDFTGSGGGGGGGVTSVNGLNGALTLAAGLNITITPSGNTITIASTGGGVTSVALADGSTIPIYAISGSPVTSAGTLQLTLNSQSANTIFAGPSSGASAQPTFRPLVLKDIPAGSNGQILTTQTGLVSWTNIVGSAAFSTVASSQVTTDSSAISSGTFTTFDNSPAFTFTPTVSGTYRVRAPMILEAVIQNTVAATQIFNTSGGATLLFNNPACIDTVTGGSSVISVQPEAIYTLTAGISYQFDVQGAIISGVGSAIARGNPSGGVTSWYMFADGIGLDNGSTSQIVRSNTTGTSGSVFSTSLTPIVDSSSVPVTATVIARGGDVEIGLMNDGTTNTSGISIDQSPTDAGCTVQIFRDGVLIYSELFYKQNNVTIEIASLPVNMFRYIDTPPAGSHTYTASIAAQNTPRSTNSVLNTILYARPMA